LFLLNTLTPELLTRRTLYLHLILFITPASLCPLVRGLLGLPLARRPGLRLILLLVRRLLGLPLARRPGLRLVLPLARGLPRLSALRGAFSAGRACRPPSRGARRRTVVLGLLISADNIFLEYLECAGSAVLEPVLLVELAPSFFFHIKQREEL
jgi:hypothetical protein